MEDIMAVIVDKGPSRIQIMGAGQGDTSVAISSPPDNKDEYMLHVPPSYRMHEITPPSMKLLAPSPDVVIANRKKWAGMVKKAQAKLLKIYGKESLPQGFEADGIYGKRTMAAVAKFQAQYMSRGSFRYGEMSVATYKAIIMCNEMNFDVENPAEDISLPDEGKIGSVLLAGSSEKSRATPSSQRVSTAISSSDNVTLGSIIRRNLGDPRSVINSFASLQDSRLSYSVDYINVMELLDGPFDINPSDYPLMGITPQINSEYRALQERANSLAMGPADSICENLADLRKDWDDFHQSHAKELWIYHQSRGDGGAIYNALRSIDLNVMVEKFPIPRNISGDITEINLYIDRNIEDVALSFVWGDVSHNLSADADRLSNEAIQHAIPTSDLDEYLRNVNSIAGNI